MKIKVTTLGKTKTHNVEDYVASQIVEEDNDMETIEDLRDVVQATAEAFGRLVNRLAREGEAGAEDVVYIAGGVGDATFIENKK